MKQFAQVPKEARGRIRIQLKIFQTKVMKERLLRENKEIPTNKNRWGSKGLSGKIKKRFECMTPITGK